jgi:hypothetical protein
MAMRKMTMTRMTTVVMQESREEGRKNNYDKHNDHDNDNSTTTNNSGRNGTATAPAYHYPRTAALEASSPRVQRWH